MHIFLKETKINILWSRFRCYKQNRIKYRHSSFYCASLYCTSQILFFLQFEGLCQPCLKQVYWCHFPKSICSLHVSASPLVSLAIFQTFHYYYICYGDLWSVIIDVTTAKRLWLIALKRGRMLLFCTIRCTWARGDHEMTFASW